MSKITKILIITASLAMISAFFFPLWQIDLEAPQYPEGLGLRIWVNKITGDLQTINGLNHYIGMKTIEPDSIKELAVMPYILVLLIILGLITGITGKRKLLWIWVVMLIAAGIAGGYDFYMWEYDYGHNLNPDAAIKVPGMSYQPPLIGSRQLLNFVAHSYPDAGGYAIIGAGLLAIALILCEYVCRKSSVKIVSAINEKKIENIKPVIGNTNSNNSVIMQH